MATADDVIAALAVVSDADDAVFLQRFFKTGPGQYGEGDVFIGVRVPRTRAVVKQFTELPLEEIDRLIESEVHEHRLAALLILNTQFARASAARLLLRDGRPSTSSATGTSSGRAADSGTERDEGQLERLAAYYLAAVRRGRVNNWDLVDGSAEFILGEYLRDRPRTILFELAESDHLWWRRVAVLSSFAFIKQGDASTTLELAELLLNDREDLMHKAVGWMLREVGKRVDATLLVGFLDAHAAQMPRTMLSYATEHLDAAVRAEYRARR